MADAVDQLFQSAPQSAPGDAVDQLFVHAPPPASAIAVPKTEAQWLAQHPVSADAIKPADAVFSALAPELALDTGAAYFGGRLLGGAAEELGVPALGRFLTGTAAGKLPARLASLATAGGWQGALAHGINKYLLGENDAGGTLGSAALGAGVNALTGGVISPYFTSRIAPEVAQLARKYIAAGVPLRLSQVPGASSSAALAGKVGTLPVAVLRKLTGVSPDDVQDLTAATMESLGSNSRRLTASTLGDAQDDIGQRLDTIAQNAGNIKDNQLHLGVLDAYAQGARNLLDPASIDRLTRVVDPILDAQDITGSGYQELTQRGSRLWQALRDPALQPYASTIRNELDNALERAAPDALEDIKLARNQYRNSMILENNPTAWNETTGMIDPAGLARAIMKKSGYQGTGKAMLASDAAGNPSNIGTLAEGAQTFHQQPVNVRNVAAGFGAGAGLLGFGELEGLPLIEYLGGHPLTTLGLGTGAASIGALQNTRAYTNWLLARAARGAGPLLGGANPAIPGVMAAYQQPPGPGPRQYSAAPYTDTIAAAGKQYGQDPVMLTRQLRQESGFNPFAVSATGAAGLGQFEPATAKQYGVDVNDPVSSIMGTARYMRDLEARFGNEGLALAAYNWGPGNLSKWLQSGADLARMPSETRNYVSSIAGMPVASFLGGAGNVAGIPVNAGGVTVTPTAQWVPPQAGAQ